MAGRLALILYSAHAELQHWRGKVLIGKWQFDNIDANEPLISRLLTEHRNAPLTVVIDTAEEELRVTRIPKVTGSARRALLNRTLEQTYPAINYRAIQSQGTVSQQRREEQILMLAISQNQMLDSWLQLLVSHQMLINRITTASLAFAELARKLKWRESYQLLIYRHADLGLRQLFLDQGKPKLSRLSAAPDAKVNLVEQFRAEAEATRIYLNNSRAMPRGAILTINILHRTGLEEPLREGLHDITGADINFTSIAAISSRLGINTGSAEVTAPILLGWLASTRPTKLTDFSTPQTQRLMKRFNRGQSLIKGAIIAAAAMAVWSATELFAVWEHSTRSQEQRNLMSRWQQLRQTAIDNALPTATPPVVMKQSFELARHFSEQRRFPEFALHTIAEVAEQLPQLRFRTVEWAAPGERLESTASRQTRNPYDLDPVDQLDANGPDLEQNEELFVEFAIEPFDGNYVYAARLANHTVTLLKNHPQVASAELFSEPLQVDSSTGFSEKIDLDSRSTDRLEARFQIVITVSTPVTTIQSTTLGPQ